MSTDALVAKDIREAAKSWLASGLESFKGEADMISGYRQDGRDLRAIAKLVREGKLKAAANAVHMLDTIVRDEVPDSFFALLKARGIEW